MTAPCSRLDDYLDGRLSDADAEAFETHTLSCSTCDAALDEAALDLSALGAVACPPEVVEAALRTARRAPTLAPDRAPAIRQRARRRFSVVPLALVAAVAIAIGVTWDRGEDGPVAPIAEAVVPADEPDALPAEVAPSDPAVSASDTTVEAEPLIPTPQPATPAPRRSAPPPAPEPTALPSDDLVAQADPTPEPAEAEPAEAEPTPAEIEAARDDLALAFHLVADAQTQARAAVRAEATPLSHTIDRALPF
ncbi:zf-HC2 domain-containing protein [Rubrivirga marina]|uniref:Putative zinc-finger domain-containing protein n=1 Tax=Rubrivirga marina TaxID=1196024 RepID=A0A271J260_9BACT|nr:zf-HC2 domain-containing protein [Rubrivirga marina]PAP77348.1 hypothetical protein BSZ37_13345 [Rubrivirga marina]